MHHTYLINKTACLY